MIDEPAMTNSNSRCPRCGAGRLQSWSELGPEEREIARRLPTSADYNLEERKARHRWCVRCWYEEVSGAANLA
jgi:ribosomal protein S27AE